MPGPNDCDPGRRALAGGYCAPPLGEWRYPAVTGFAAARAVRGAGFAFD